MKTRQIRKWFWAWEFEREEKWLNDMARKGWLLDEVSFCRFRFVECEPGAYAVRMEMLEHQPHSEKGQDYIAFLEETGAEFVGSVIKWAYFRKRTEEGPFDLFSDIDSRVRYLDRLIRSWACIGGANLCIGMANLRLSGLGLINIAVAVMLGCSALQLKRKKERLQAERTLYE